MSAQPQSNPDPPHLDLGLGYELADFEDQCHGLSGHHASQHFDVERLSAAGPGGVEDEGAVQGAASPACSVSSQVPSGWVKAALARLDGRVLGGRCHRVSAIAHTLIQRGALNHSNCAKLPQGLPQRCQRCRLRQVCASLAERHARLC